MEIVIEEKEKINNNERLEIEKAEGIIKKVSEESRTKERENLEWKLRFLTVKCRFLKNLSDYEN